MLVRLSIAASTLLTAIPYSACGADDGEGQRPKGVEQKARPSDDRKRRVGDSAPLFVLRYTLRATPQ